MEGALPHPIDLIPNFKSTHLTTPTRQASHYSGGSSIYSLPASAYINLACHYACCAVFNLNPAGFYLFLLCLRGSYRITAQHAALEAAWCAAKSVRWPSIFTAGKRACNTNPPPHTDVMQNERAFLSPPRCFFFSLKKQQKFKFYYCALLSGSSEPPLNPDNNPDEEWVCSICKPRKVCSTGNCAALCVPVV